MNGQSTEATAIHAAQELANHGDTVDGAFGDELERVLADMLPGERRNLANGCRYLINEISGMED